MAKAHWNIRNFLIAEGEADGYGRSVRNTCNYTREVSMMTPKMFGAISHPLVEKILTYQRAMAAGDLVTARTAFSRDVTYTVPGNNPFSGTYKGPDDVMSYFERLMAATNGSYAITEMTWLVCESKVVLATLNVAIIGSRSLEWREAVLFEFRDGLKFRIDLFQAKQSDVDDFFIGAL